MDVIHPHCAGLDVHKKQLWLVSLHPIPKEGGKEIQTFTTMTGSCHWLIKACTHVAMESTGEYKPIFNILESSFE